MNGSHHLPGREATTRGSEARESHPRTYHIQGFSSGSSRALAVSTATGVPPFRSPLIATSKRTEAHPPSACALSRTLRVNLLRTVPFFRRGNRPRISSDTRLSADDVPGPFSPRGGAASEARTLTHPLPRLLSRISRSSVSSVSSSPAHPHPPPPSGGRGGGGRDERRRSDTLASAEPMRPVPPRRDLRPPPPARYTEIRMRASPVSRDAGWRRGASTAAATPVRGTSAVPQLGFSVHATGSDRYTVVLEGGVGRG